MTFRDTGKEFELKRDLSKKITNKNSNVHPASLSDKKLMYTFAKEMKFGVKAKGNNSKRDRTLKKLHKLPGISISASGISNAIFLLSDLNGLCDRLKLLPQEKPAENNSDIINEETVAIVDKL